MELFTLEQVEVLMMVAGSDQPVQTAAQVRRRWHYIRGVALAAQRGESVDPSLPQVARESDQYLARADRILAAVDGWLAEQAGAPGPGTMTG